MSRTQADEAVTSAALLGPSSGVEERVDDDVDVNTQHRYFNHNDIERQPIKFNVENARLSGTVLAGVADVPSSSGLEYSIPFRTKLIQMSLYVAFSVGIVLYDKYVLGQFDYPWILVALHSTSAGLGCGLMMHFYRMSLTPLTLYEHLVILAFSLIFTTSIAALVAALVLVSVPFHQLIGTLLPAFTVLIYHFVYSRSYSTPTYLSLIPMIVGLGLATYGGYNFTAFSFALTLLGVLLSAVRNVAVNRIMTGSLALHPYEIMVRMAPWAAIESLLFSYLFGDLSRLRHAWQDGQLKPSLGPLLLGDIAIAFCLNLSSLQANKVAGALTVGVGQNFTQVFSILFGILLWHVEISVINGIGMFVTLLGAAWYSKVELDSTGI